MIPQTIAQQKTGNLIRRTMIVKYLRCRGHIACRLWMYAVALDSLQQHPDVEKADFLLHEAYNYLKSYNFTFHAGKEEAADLQKIIDELTLLTINC